MFSLMATLVMYNQMKNQPPMSPLTLIVLPEPSFSNKINNYSKIRIMHTIFWGLNMFDKILNRNNEVAKSMFYCNKLHGQVFFLSVSYRCVKNINFVWIENKINVGSGHRSNKFSHQIFLFSKRVSIVQSSLTFLQLNFFKSKTNFEFCTVRLPSSNEYLHFSIFSLKLLTKK